MTDVARTQRGPGPLVFKPRRWWFNGVAPSCAGYLSRALPVRRVVRYSARFVLGSRSCQFGPLVLPGVWMGQSVRRPLHRRDDLVGGYACSGLSSVLAGAGRP
jgi:hypothetical protein